MKLHRLGLAVAVLAGIVGPHDAVGKESVRPAARFRVAITEFAFTPKNIQIRVGDQITWTNNGRMTHTTTANNGMWNSGNMPPESKFTFTFNTAGTFPYRCTLHPVQMTGNVRVINPTDD